MQKCKSALIIDIDEGFYQPDLTVYQFKGNMLREYFLFYNYFFFVRMGFCPGPSQNHEGDILPLLQNHEGEFVHHCKTTKGIFVQPWKFMKGILSEGDFVQIPLLQAVWINKGPLMIQNR